MHKMTVLPVLFGVLIAVLTFVPQTAYGCSCAAPNDSDAQKSYAGVDLVVDAEIVALSKGWGGHNPVAIMEINHIHKGQKPPLPQITARYNTNTAACGLHLAVGEKYVLGLYYLGDANNATNGETGYRLTNICDQMQIRHYVDALKVQESQPSSTIMNKEAKE